MILIIRGHIRNTFDNNNFYNLIKKIYINQPNIKIYIHTWNILSSDTSWRKIEKNTKIINYKQIYNYFNDLQHLIEHIIIDDDTKINLIGNLEGKISSSNMPTIGWKKYWYGKYKIIEYIYHLDINDIIINTRFDILDNSNSIDDDIIINFINNSVNKEIKKNILIYNEEKYGLDNIYIGNTCTMYKLIHYFNYELDNILTVIETTHQEYIVSRINNLLFD